MSYSVFRLQGIKTTNDLKGLGKHNKERISFTNPDIDLEKSKNNIELIKCEGSYINAFDKITLNMKKQHYERMKKIRKDRVKTFNQFVNSNKSDVACEMIFTSDEEFFKNLNEDDIKDWARVSLNFVIDDIGIKKENIIHAVIHMDEKTPHLHIVSVPIVNSYDKRIKANRLSISRAKYIENKFELSSLQDKYNFRLKENGFNLERGLKFTDKKHTKTASFKAEIRKSIDEEIKNINKELEKKNDLNLGLNSKNKSLITENYILERELNNKNRTIKNIRDIPKYEKIDFIKIPELEINRNILRQYVINKNEYNNLKNIVTDLNNKYIELQKSYNTLKENYYEINLENERLNKSLKNEIEIKNDYKKQVKEINIAIEKSKNLTGFKRDLINRYDSKINLKEQEHKEELENLERAIERKYKNKICKLENEINDIKDTQFYLSPDEYLAIGISANLTKPMNDLANTNKNEFRDVIKNRALKNLVDEKNRYDRLKNHIKNEKNISEDNEFYYKAFLELYSEINASIDVFEKVGLFKELDRNNIEKIPLWNTDYLEIKEEYENYKFDKEFEENLKLERERKAKERFRENEYHISL